MKNKKAANKPLCTYFLGEFLMNLKLINRRAKFRSNCYFIFLNIGLRQSIHQEEKKLAPNNLLVKTLTITISFHRIITEHHKYVRLKTRRRGSSQAYWRWQMKIAYRRADDKKWSPKFMTLSLNKG